MQRPLKKRNLSLSNFYYLWHKAAHVFVGGFVLSQKEMEMIVTNIMTHKKYSNDPAQLEQQIRQVQSKERYYQQQKKILLHEQAQLERKKRNHRIFIRGGMLEVFMQKPLLLTDDQVYRLLQAAFDMETVRNLENDLITEAVNTLKENENQEETG